MIEPDGIFPKNISLLLVNWSTSLTLITDADTCVALFHMICPLPGSPVVTPVFA
jgi:hypothetical protein